MQKLNRILFVASGEQAEQAALAQATALAQANDSELLTLMDICSSVDGDHRSRGYSISSAPVLNVEGGSRVKLQTRQTLQDVIEATQRHDLVIKPVAKEASKLHYGLRDEDRQLIRRSSCPVWIVKKQARRRQRKILAAVDFDAIKQNSIFAQSIMAHAIALAQQENAVLHVAHTWQMRHELALRGRMNVTSLLKDMKKAHKKQLDALLREYSFPHAVVHFKKGDPREVIPELVEKRGIDLTIIGHRERTGLWRFLKANTAESLVDRLACSLLVINRYVAHRYHEPAGQSRSFEAPRRAATSAHV